MTHQPHIQGIAAHHLQRTTDGKLDPFVVVAKSATAQTREEDHV